MKDNSSKCSLDSIVNGVRSGIHYLIEKGYSPDSIVNWIRESIHPDGLTVTKDYRILLAKTGREVVMRPLEKTLYLFFLKLEPGCRFKELPQYEDELLRIYNRITAFDDVKENQRRIARLADPLSKSFLEKCSVIRRAFLEEMPDMEAELYYISGSRGERRKIILDRTLVKWESEFWI